MAGYELEVAGAGIMFDNCSGTASHVFGALEDGSLCLWDARGGEMVTVRLSDVPLLR
jgi:hypothetical protein